MNMSSPLIALTLVGGMAAVTIAQDGIWPVIWIVGGSAVVTAIIIATFIHFVQGDEERKNWRKLSWRQKWAIMSDNGDF